MRAVGARQARALFLTAAILRAERAQAIGLVHEVAPDGGLSAARDRVVEALLLGAPGAQAQSKRLVEHCLGRNLDAALMRRTACLLAERRASAEGLEGLSGFLEKRAPNWRTPMKA
jgi:methylglutaconyl-CoA hydratase